MKHKILVCLVLLTLAFYSCKTDDLKNQSQTSVIGNWVISEIIYNNNNLPFGECTDLEHINFYEDNSFSWELYAVTEFNECVPIPATTGTWEYLENRSVKLTNDTYVHDVLFTETTLTMEFGEEATDSNPESNHFIFVFLRY